MPGSLTVNDATDRQLRILLGVETREISLIRDLRPITSKAMLGALPSSAQGRIRETLEIEKLDLNETDKDSLAQIAEISPALANSIAAHKPYYLSLELRSIEGIDADSFTRITSYFAPRPLGYVDKLSGRKVDLSPDTSRLLVSLHHSDEESARTFERRHALPKSRDSGANSGYKVVLVPESEGHIDKLNELKNDSLVDYVVPAFSRSTGDSVFMDPRLCVVQFRGTTTQARQVEILGRAQLGIRERHRTPGLVTVGLVRAEQNPVSIMDAIRVLNDDPEVDFAEPAFIASDDLETATAPNIWSLGEANRIETGRFPWNLRLVGIDAGAPPIGGSSDVVIAIIDTGIDLQHPAISADVLARPYGESWNFSDDSDPVPSDDEGHGTFIAGLLVGREFGQAFGIARGCSILPLKVPLTGTSPSYARRRDAILYALDFVPSPRRLVINLSWKTTGDVSLIRDAVSQAVMKGALVVASAGNWPREENEAHFPSDYAECLSVGAVGPDGRRANYSYYGREIDIMAPGGSGSDIVEENLSSAQPGGSYGVDFGTSFASPHVAGVAALTLSQQPDLTVAALRQALLDGATTIADAGSGYGLLSVPATLHRVRGPSTTLGAERQDYGLDAVNTFDLESLCETFGLLRMTARLIIVRRPFADLLDIVGVLGLSDEQYARIVAYHT